jgi:hypothetical protein
MLMETETMLPADLALVAAPALTPWGMYLAADVVVKAVMIALALASLATWTVLLAKGWELARQARQLRAARALLLQSAQLPTQSEEATLQQGAALAMLELHAPNCACRRSWTATTASRSASPRAWSASSWKPRACSGAASACSPASARWRRSSACSVRCGAS